MASVTEDADAINAIHNAVLGGGKVVAVDAPDGEHDLEDVVSWFLCSRIDEIDGILSRSYLFVLYRREAIIV